jgi:hypothetical protein
MLESKSMGLGHILAHGDETAHVQMIRAPQQRRPTPRATEHRSENTHQQSLQVLSAGETWLELSWDINQTQKEMDSKQKITIAEPQFDQAQASVHQECCGKAHKRDHRF